MTMAVVFRCPSCKRIECAKVIGTDPDGPVWKAYEKVPVEQVRQERWCGGHE